MPLAGAQGGGALKPLDETTATPAKTGALVFLQALGLALLGGLVLNLMPCVFPVLAMKAASLSAAAHDPARARRDGLAFTAGVLVSFLVLAGVLLALRGRVRRSAGGSSFSRRAWSRLWPWSCCWSG